MKAKIFAFFMILAVLTVMAGGEAMALTKVNFQLNWKITGDHAPYYVALKKGWFQEEGLDVNIILGQGSGYTVKVLALLRHISPDFSVFEAKAPHLGRIGAMRRIGTIAMIDTRNPV